MKSALILVLGVLVLGYQAKAEECSKENAEKQVKEVCEDIIAKGKDVKKEWPKKLLFENCGKNYVWVQDTDEHMKMVMHPIKVRLNGQALDTHVDENNFKLFVEFDKAAKKKADGDWVDYVWAKPGKEKASSKTSFVKLCKSKDGTAWIAGSGVWKEDLKPKK